MRPGAGSVRVPSSYCGILGIRPTHGRVSLTNACPLAPSLDTGAAGALPPLCCLHVAVLLGDLEAATACSTMISLCILRVCCCAARLPSDAVHA